MSPLLQLISSIGLDVASPHAHAHTPLAHYLIIYFFVFFFDLAGIQLVEDVFSPSRSSPYSTPSISLLSSMRTGMSRARPPRSTNRSLGTIHENSVVVSTPTPSARTLGREPKSSDLSSALSVGTGTGTYPDAVVAELVPLPLCVSSANKAPRHASLSARRARAGRALPRPLDTAMSGESRYDVLNAQCADLTPIPAEEGWLTPKPLFEDMRASLWGASLLDYPDGSTSRYDVEEDELERLSKSLECAMDAALAMQDIVGEAAELADKYEQWRVHAAPAEEFVAESTDGEFAATKSLAGESGTVAADEESFLLPPTPPLPFSLPERSGNRPARLMARSSADREAMVEWSAAGRTWSMKQALAQWAADVEARKQKARVVVVAGTAWDQRLGNYQLANKAKEQEELKEEGMEAVKPRPLRPHGFVVVDEDRDEDESQEEWEEPVKKMHREL